LLQWLLAFAPLLPGLGSVFAVVLLTNGGLRILSGVTAIASLAFFAARLLFGNSRSDRSAYLANLELVDRKIRYAQREELGELRATHPAVADLPRIVASLREVWQRRPDDPDFLNVRLGDGKVAAAARSLEPAVDLDGLDPVCSRAALALVAKHAYLDDAPMTLNVANHRRIDILDTGDAARDAVRAILSALAVFHAPQDLVIAVAATEDRLPEWDWVKWLPHAQHRILRDASGPARLIATESGLLTQLLGDWLRDRSPYREDAEPGAGPRVVVLFDGVEIPAPWWSGTWRGVQDATFLVITVEEPAAGERVPLLNVARAANRGALTVWHGAERRDGTADLLGEHEARVLARRMASLVLEGADAAGASGPAVELTDLLGIGDAAEFDVRDGWRALSARERLRVPIGVDERGEPVILDLKEAAMDGMGPHGLCVGAIGSGKSEVLRTLVLALAATHSSENLNFVLADFKGGATFSGMERMPHTAALITNLENDTALVDRMGDAVEGELNRRQELLYRTTYKNIHDYEAARAAGAALEPLPNLVIVLDEFSEMLAARPEFLETCIRVARTGRSLGIHLLLASQRLEEGRLRGLDTFLSYRIGLKTFSAEESRRVLGTPHAFALPRIPGSGYLKTTDEKYNGVPGIRFTGAYASAFYTPPSAKDVPWQPQLFAAAFQPSSASAEKPTGGPSADVVLDMLVARMEGQGPAARRIWLPPLDESPAIGALMPEAVATQDQAQRARQAGPAHAVIGWEHRRRDLTVPLGIADSPRTVDRLRYPLVVDLSAGGGHVAIVGAPLAGKSVAASTLLIGLALGHTPAEAQFYILDFGGGLLATLDALPHTCACAVGTRSDAAKARRIVAAVLSLLDQREEYFHDHGIDPIDTVRGESAPGEPAEGAPYGDVFLVVDGWATIRTTYGYLEEDILEIARRGLSYGVHVIITAARWVEVPSRLMGAISTRIELRLGDPENSAVDRRVAARVPADRPGRGLTRDGLHFQTALPLLTGGSAAEPAAHHEHRTQTQEPGRLKEGLAATARAIADSWAGPGRHASGCCRTWCRTTSCQVRPSAPRGRCRWA